MVAECSLAQNWNLALTVRPVCAMASVDEVEITGYFGSARAAFHVIDLLRIINGLAALNQKAVE